MTDKSASPQEKLKKFFETAPVARRAIEPLSKGVAVNIHFVEGAFPDLKPVAPLCHFLRVPAGGTVVSGEHRDPDFTLYMPPLSVDRLGAITSDDPGEFGVEFFKLCMSKDDKEKIRVRIHTGPLKLLAHGYFGVIKAGGWKMLTFLKQNGVLGIGGFKGVINRLRGNR